MEKVRIESDGTTAGTKAFFVKSGEEITDLIEVAFHASVEEMPGALIVKHLDGRRPTLSDVPAEISATMEAEVTERCPHCGTVTKFEVERKND